MDPYLAEVKTEPRFEKTSGSGGKRRPGRRQNLVDNVRNNRSGRHHLVTSGKSEQLGGCLAAGRATRQGRRALMASRRSLGPFVGSRLPGEKLNAHCRLP